MVALCMAECIISFRFVSVIAVAGKMALGKILLLDPADCGTCPHGIVWLKE
jgi:hypothetical protein